MRLLQQINDSIPAVTARNYDCFARGARGAMLQLQSTTGTNRVQVFDQNQTGTLIDTVASMFAPLSDPTFYSWLFTPVVNGVLRLNNISGALLLINLGLYDEPPEEPRGRFISTRESFSVAAAATSTRADVDPGRYPNVELIWTADRANNFRIDLSLSGGERFLRVSEVVTNPAVTFGMRQSFVAMLPRWRVEIQNLDGLNPCNVIYIASVVR